jgi:hypothetical protein
VRWAVRWSTPGSRASPWALRQQGMRCRQTSTLLWPTGHTRCCGTTRGRCASAAATYRQWSLGAWHVWGMQVSGFGLHVALLDMRRHAVHACNSSSTFLVITCYMNVVICYMLSFSGH